MKHIVFDKVEIKKDVCHSDKIEINGIEYVMRQKDFDEIALYEVGVN